LVIVVDNDAAQINVDDFRPLIFADVRADDVDILGRPIVRDAAGALQEFEHRLRASIGDATLRAVDLANDNDVLAAKFTDAHVNAQRKSAGFLGDHLRDFRKRPALDARLAIIAHIDAAIGGDLVAPVEFGPRVDLQFNYIGTADAIVTHD